MPPVPEPAADGLRRLWGWGVLRAGCTALVWRQPGETPAAPSVLAPRGPAGESHLAAGELGFPSQALLAQAMGAPEGSGSSSPLLVSLPAAMSPCHVPPTVHPGVPGWHRSRRGDPEGGRHPLTAQRLLHDEVHGAGVRVRLGQRPALIHCCPGSLTRATCTGREGHGRGRRAQGPHCPGVRDGTLPGGCSLHPLHLQPRTPSRMGRGSFGGLWAEVGQICLLAAPAPLGPLPTGLLAPWWRDQSRDPRGTLHLSIALGVAGGGQQEPGSPGVLLPGGLVRWGPTTPPPTAYPCFGGGDDARPCLGTSAWHSQTRGAVRTSVCLTATRVLWRGMEKRLLAGCDSVWGLQGLQAAACDSVCDPCGCWRWVMACRGAACAGWSACVYAVFACAGCA